MASLKKNKSRRTDGGTIGMVSPLSRVLELYGYQKKWVQDPSRFKLYEKSRQIGISFAAALELVLDCLEHKTTWVVLSRGERQSEEFMEHVKAHAGALKAALDLGDTPFWCENEKIEVKQLRVTFPNGSRIIGLPANPDTARGFSGNLVLDEFAFHKDARKIWKACFPIVSRAGRKLRVISTHNGKDSFFYELASGSASGETPWSKHRTDIYQAVADGCPQDIEELRAAINDPDAWQEEFECIPLDTVSNWLGNDLITRAELNLYVADADVISWDGPAFKPEEGDWFLGGDIGRKRDLTVLYLIQRVAGVSWTRRIERLRRKTFNEQWARIQFCMTEYPVNRAGLDATGLGMQLAEQAVMKFGSRAEAVTFTPAVKENLAVTLKRRFEDGLLRIPADRDLRADLRAVKKFLTTAGNVRFDAERSDAGHADHFWALALAEHAASGPAQKIEYRPVGDKRPSAELRANY